MKSKLEKAKEALQVLIMYATEDREDDEIDTVYDAAEEIEAVLNEAQHE